MAAGCVGEEPSFPECDAGAPFDVPTPLADLEIAPSTESGLTLDGATENRAYFSSARNGQAAALFTARRENRGGLFVDIAPVDAAPAGATRAHVVSELVMYFAAEAIYVSKRASVAEPFGAPVKLAITHDGRAAVPRCPSIDADGKTLYYSDGDAIYEQALAQPETPSTRISELAGFSCLVPSADRVEGFVRGGDGRVYRSTHGASWSAPVVVPQLSRDGEPSEVTYLTRNRCDVYLTRNHSGAEHVYWAHRTPR